MGSKSRPAREPRGKSHPPHPFLSRWYRPLESPLRIARKPSSPQSGRPPPDGDGEMLHSKTRLLVVSVILGLSACLLSPAPASAGSPSFTLFTNANDGWGSTNTSLTNPGPPLLVYQGDNVTLVLNGTDATNHNWFIDYDNDSRDDANEPKSLTFQDTAITWNFTADVNGTYYYRDRFNTAN